MRKSLASAGVGLLMWCTATHAVECGDVITEDAILRADVGPCQTGLTVVGPAKLNLNGHTVFGDQVAPGMAIHLVGRGARLENGVVKGAEDGVVLAGEGHHQVERIVSTGHGIEGFLVLSDGNRLADDVADENDGHGFRVRGARNRLIGNTATGNRFFGFTLRGDRNVLRGNLGAYNNVGFGLDRLDGSFGGHKVSENVALRNVDAGFVVGTFGTRLVGNRAVANGNNGIRHDGSENTLVGNLSVDNVANDLFESSIGCVGNRWRRNVFGTSSQECIE